MDDQTRILFRIERMVWAIANAYADVIPSDLHHDLILKNIDRAIDEAVDHEREIEGRV